MSDVGGEIPDLTKEISIIGITPKFVGTYSYVFKGRYRGEIVSMDYSLVAGLILLGRNQSSTGAFGVSTRYEKSETIDFDFQTLIGQQMRHPNVVPLYGYAADNESFGSFGAFISPVKFSIQVGIHF